MGSKTKQCKAEGKIPGTASNFAGFKENNAQLLLQRSHGLLFCEKI